MLAAISVASLGSCSSRYRNVLAIADDLPASVTEFLVERQGAASCGAGRQAGPPPHYLRTRRRSSLCRHARCDAMSRTSDFSIQPHDLLGPSYREVTRTKGDGCSGASARTTRPGNRSNSICGLTSTSRHRDSIGPSRLWLVSSNASTSALDAARRSSWTSANRPARWIHGGRTVCPYPAGGSLCGDISGRRQEPTPVNQ